MLAVLSHCVGCVDDGEDGDEDHMTAGSYYSLLEEEGSDPEDQTLDDDNGGPPHALEEGQLE